MGVLNAGDLKWLADTPTRAPGAGRAKKRKRAASSGKRRSTGRARPAKRKSASRGRARSRKSAQAELDRYIKAHPGIKYSEAFRQLGPEFLARYRAETRKAAASGKSPD